MNKMKFEQSGSENKNGRFNFYAALGLCICAAAAVGWSVFGAPKKNIDPGVTGMVSAETAGEMYVEGEEYIETEASLVSSLEESIPESSSPAESTVKTTPAQTKTTTTTKKVAVQTEEVFEDDMGATQVDAPAGGTVYTLPVTGKLLKQFSGDDLVYCETMCDWRVHDGIDIAAKKGTKVKTAAAGKVVDIMTDEMFGTTVVISHDKLLAYYRGLAENVTVKKGQTIDAGTVIGAVAGVPCECALECHIHLSVKQNGDFVDPIKVMGLKLS
ncbi:MAG: M23 family metallopeptidase [Clostridia bacterium]|nr:M23 family metallopeptidase [Clostridia bacterium]